MSNQKDRPNRDKEIEELEKQLKQMEEKSKKLFDKVGVTPHELHHMMNNKENFSKEAWDALQKQQQEIEMILERRIDEAQAKIKKKPSPFDVKSGGHWIFVR